MILVNINIRKDNIITPLTTKILVVTRSTETGTNLLAFSFRCPCCGVFELNTVKVCSRDESMQKPDTNLLTTYKQFFLALVYKQHIEHTIYKLIQSRFNVVMYMK